VIEMAATKKLQVRLRDVDKALRGHFRDIPSGDEAHEARRLMLLGLKAEKGEGYLKELEKKAETE
jgi:hypothetical protein